MKKLKRILEHTKSTNIVSFYKIIRLYFNCRQNTVSCIILLLLKPFGLWTKCVSNYRRRSFSQNGHSLSCCYSSYSLLNFQLSINHCLLSFPHLNHFSIILKGSFLGSSLYHKTKQPKNKKTNKTAKQSTVCLNETYETFNVVAK